MKRNIRNKIKMIKINSLSILKINNPITLVTMVVLINASIAGGITGLIPEVEKLDIGSVLEYSYEFSD